MSKENHLDQYPNKYKPLENVTDIRNVDIPALNQIIIQLREDIQILEAMITLQNHQVNIQSKDIYNKIKSKTQALSYLIYNKEDQFPPNHFPIVETAKHLKQAVKHLKSIKDLPSNY